MKRRNVNAKSNKILVLLDREQGAQKTAEANGLELFSLIPFKTKGVNWLKNRFSSLEYEVISDYLLNSDKYQNETIQNNLKNQANK
jgi:orotate phosphoribosyltransferase